MKSHCIPSVSQDITTKKTHEIILTERETGGIYEYTINHPIHNPGRVTIPIRSSR